MKKAILLFITIISFLNCTKDKIDIPVTTTIETLNGSWSLAKVSCGACITVELEPGDVYWIFDEIESELSVQNNSSQPIIFDTDTYDIDISVDINTLGLPQWFDTTNKYIIDIDSNFLIDRFFYYFEEEKLYVVGFDGENITFELTKNSI